MKRFIIISLLCLGMGMNKAYGCAGMSTHNYYLFSVTGSTTFQQRVDEISRKNWIAYGDGAIQYGYNTDEFIEVARKKGDQLMVSYVQQLKKYLKCSDQIRYSWDYPTKEEVAKRNQTLTAVRAYAQSKLGTRLRSQHGLLFMRCNMLLNRHTENIKFWEQTASKYIETVYKEMMQNIYAGALLKAGRKAEGAAIFAQQNDKESLYTCYYKGRSAAAIRQEYQRDPNSPVLPFLLQDFVNNTQEAYDTQNNQAEGGKLFIRDISKEEAMQMCALAQQAISEGKTENPALWRSAEAMLQWFFGNRNTALKLANEAVGMNGTERIKDNARVVRLFIRSDRSAADSNLDNFLADELPWLESKMKDDFFFGMAFDRITTQVLVNKYTKRGPIGTALLAAYCDISSQPWEGEAPTGSNQDHSSEFFCHIDSITPQQLLDFANYVKAPQTRLETWIAKHVKLDNDYVNDLLATKYLRRGEWQNAINSLKKVPLSYLQQQLIVPYMAQRSYKALPWADPKDVEEGNPENYPIKKSQKMEFAEEMLRLENGYSALNGEQQRQRAFDLAVRYYQSSVYGQAWYLTRYAKSVYDEQRNDEIDRMAKAAQLLGVAKQSTNFLLKEKALYALAYLPDQPWLTEEWNENSGRYEKRLHRSSRQYRALSELLAFKKQNATRISPYVSRCDVLKQFQKQQ